MPRLDGQGGVYELPPEPRARIDRDDYEEILAEHLPNLIALSGLEALVLLCETLDAANTISSDGTRSNPSDFSNTWMPAIGQEQEPFSRDERVALTEAIRKGAEEIAAGDPRHEAPRILELFGRFHWHIFRRLELSIIHAFADAVPEAAIECLRDLTLLDTPAVWGEYRVLAREKFASLPASDQESIFQWINGGPDRAVMVERLRGWNNTDPNEEDLATLTRKWQWQRLNLFREHLPPDWAT
jgi:hypothetical protein